jgi:hypothetical protein
MAREGPSYEASLCADTFGVNHRSANKGDDAPCGSGADMRSEMPIRKNGRTLPKATPALAQRVWARHQRPSVRSVARALQRAGYPVHFVTVARWRAQNWRAEASDHPLEIARAQLEAVASLATGDPETTIDDFINDPVRKREFDELTDAEVLQRAAREVAIATAVVFNAFKSRATSSDFELLKLTPALAALARCVHALPNAFDQMINLDAADQRRSNGFQNKGGGEC